MTISRVDAFRFFANALNDKRENDKEGKLRMTKRGKL